MKSMVSVAHVRVFRAVQGAVVNTAHGHPDWKITPTMAESIAKRATGTLTAQWPDVLAARIVPSEANDPIKGGYWPPRRGRTATAKGAGLPRTRPRQFRKLQNIIGSWAGTARRQKDYMKLQILTEVLREIDKIGRG